MFNWQKIIVIAFFSTFPLTLYFFYTQQKTAAVEARSELSHKQADTGEIENHLEIEKIVEHKIKQVAQIDLKILAAQGEALRYQEQKKSLIKDLELLIERVKPFIEQNRSKDLAKMGRMSGEN